MFGDYVNPELGGEFSVEFSSPSQGELPGVVAGGAASRRRGDGAEPVTTPLAPVPTRPRQLGHRPLPGSALRRHPTTEVAFNPEQRLLILDAWRRSGLPGGDFAPLVGVSKRTLYAW